MGFDIHVDEEDNQLSDVSAEQVFCKTKSLEKKLSQPSPVLPKTEANVESFYDEQDSDNDSDFEPIYKITQDSHSDLKTLQKPLFLTDLI